MERLRWKLWIFLIGFSVIYCELIADYLTTLKCSWPDLKTEEVEQNNDQVLKAMILADTHLLGPLRGHWLDKLYREWHMKNAFQAAIRLLQPDVVFVLGDLFDEGDISGANEFEEFVKRFHSHFQTPSGTPIISAVGNHDVGFHYSLVNFYRMHPYFTERFEKNFNNTGVQLYKLKGSYFVFINSMAMENDRCYFCEAAHKELLKISEQLDCLFSTQTCPDENFVPAANEKYSKPIIMQHFPTYRVSDKACIDTDTEVFEKYRQNWEVLSKSSTDLIGAVLKPRLAFAGHSHNYCYSKTRWGADEYTVASFNWRNKINPSFLLATITPNEYNVAKCNMLSQTMIQNMYCIAFLTILLFKMFEIFMKLTRPRQETPVQVEEDK